MKLNFAALAERQRTARMRRRVALALAGLGLGTQVQAGPAGGVVTHGHGSISQQGGQTTVRAGNNTVINWKTFNIGAGETTTFIQPSSASVVWNRITDKNPSQIFGNLNANGFVVLFNQSGFYFGPDSVVKVGGLLVSTAPVTMPGDNGGASWTYNGPPPTPSIINYGKMETKEGGSLFLVAEKIENHGTLTAPDGTLGLYAGKEVLVTESPDGRGLSARVVLPEGSIDNTGKLIADAGTIALHAQTVNNGGLIQANSVREHNGVIEIVGTESVHLSAQSELAAKGDATSLSPGGSVTVKSDGRFTDDVGSAIDVRGGAAGGNGGSVEISAAQIPAIHSRVDGTAQAGFKGGSLLIDPTDIVFGVNTGEDPDALYLDPNDSPSPFIGLTTISYQATRDIFFPAFSTWNLNASTGVSDSGSLLTLEAGRNILFGESARLVAGAGWSVSLTADSGGIYLNGGPDIFGARQNGGGAIETQDGSITLKAGTDVLVGSGYVRTTQGGNIGITAGGTVDAGTKTDGYSFTRFGPQLSPNGLGGIATGQGGNIKIDAGQNIVTGPSAIGAYGAGDVSLTTHAGSVEGRFLVANGQGTINTAYDFGSGGSPSSLALAKGGWTVNAGHDIFLNEVYNPNGAQNPNRVNGNRFNFDYDAAASVTLNAMNGVHLLGNDLLRTASNPDRPPIYAPQLSITAGAGGIELGNDVVLAPSPLGSLSLVTYNGGSLFSTPGSSFQLVMSDSGSPDYHTWVTGHADVPLHRDNHTIPVIASIDGDIDNVLMQVPKQAMITVKGNTLNFAFEGQNLDPSDVTSINVSGDVKSRGNRTSADESTAPNANVFDPILTSNPLLGNKLVYDDKTHTLSFVGKMTDVERDFLLNPQIKELDNLGNVRLDSNGNAILVPAHYADTSVILALYNGSQDIPSSPNAFRGLQIGGPGQFNISAHDMDLGITGGIRSQGTLLNPALSAISPPGADVNLSVSHDLEMGASQIASFSGGNLSVHADHQINVGSDENFTSDETPKGIFSSSGGNVSVTAGGNINVNGSRIATYNGGNISVISDHGNIDAGAGGLGSVSVFRTVVDPVTHAVSINSTTIPGSGILATTLPGTDTRIGNIDIEAKDGSVIANSGGVLQLSFNTVKENDAATISIQAYGHATDADKGNISAKNSGIIGGNVTLKADGDVTGLVVAKQDINIDSGAKVTVTALAQGSANVSGNISGSTIVGGTAVTTSGSVENSSLVGNSVSTTGPSSGTSTGIGTSQAAASTKVDDSEKTIATASKPKDDDDDLLKKKSKTKTIGRVTVILPEKK